MPTRRNHFAFRLAAVLAVALLGVGPQGGRGDDGEDDRPPKKSAAEIRKILATATATDYSELEGNDRTIPAMVKLLQRIYRVRIDVNKAAIKKAGLLNLERIGGPKITERGLTFYRLLRKTISHYDGLTFTIVDGAILITTDKDLANRKLRAEAPPVFPKLRADTLAKLARTVEIDLSECDENERLLSVVELGRREAEGQPQGRPRAAAGAVAVTGPSRSTGRRRWVTNTAAASRRSAARCGRSGRASSSSARSPPPTTRAPTAGAALPAQSDRPDPEPEDQPRQGARPDAAAGAGGRGLPRDGRAPRDQGAVAAVSRFVTRGDKV